MKKVFLILFLFPAFLFSQQKKIDSLSLLLRADREDSTKVIHLNDLCRRYIDVSNYDTARYFVNTAFQLAQKINYTKGIATAYNNLGLINDYKGEYPEALKYYNLALKIRMDLSDKKGIAGTYMDIGIIYHMLGDYPQALNYFFSSLKIKEELGDKRIIANTLGNIAATYYFQGSNDDALKNYLASIKIRKEINDQQGLLFSYAGIGSVYFNLGNDSAALDNQMKALRIAKELGRKQDMTDCYNSIGLTYESLMNYELAAQNFDSAITISKAIDNKLGVASGYINLGNLFIRQNKIPEAKKLLDDALQLAKETRGREVIKEAYQGLSRLDSATGNYAGAFQNYQMFILYKDSVSNEENIQKTVRSQMSYEFNKISTADSVKNVEQAKWKDIETQGKLQQEKTKRYALYGGLVLLLIFGGFMFNRFRITQKQKRIIEIKSRETEQQKEIIEEKQKEIVDSINYAKRIQYTLLAHEQLLNENLAEHFVLFKPKDIVSGDFYWATEKKGGSSQGQEAGKGGLFYLAVCDSTGHGVPGAFMSLLNISFLNEAIIEKNILAPNEILNHVRKRLIENISQDGGQDGMDAILICIDKIKNTITYSAAHNSPLLIRNGEMQHLPADKMPVGKGEKNDSFTLHTIDVQKGDTLYLFTDGYADQFGGPKGKKFKHKQLSEELTANSEKELVEQKNILENVFTSWKGNLEQVDDVLIIGIKI